MKENKYLENAVEQFAEVFIEKLEMMQKAEWTKPWFTEGAMYAPKNVRGTGYNGSNSIMLMFLAERKGYAFPIWGTFKQYIEMSEQGAEEAVCVNKGETSVPVFYTSFSVYDGDGKKISFDDYKVLSESEKAQYKVYPSTTIYRVFNIDQTNMERVNPKKYEELTKKYKKQESVADDFVIPTIDKMLEDQLWRCPIQLTYQDKAYYVPQSDKIVLPKREQFKSGESFYGTLLHEMTHSTGAKGCLDRDMSMESEKYAMEELVAELTAAFTLASYNGASYIKEDSMSYVKCWIENIKKDPSVIRLVLGDVKKAGKYIDERLAEIKL